MREKRFPWGRERGSYGSQWSPSKHLPPAHITEWRRPSTLIKSALPLLLSHFSHVRFCATPPLGFSRQEHWSGLPFPTPMHKSEKWKWSRSVVSDSSRPHGLQPTRLLRPWDFPGKSTGVGCHCLLRKSTLRLHKTSAHLSLTTELWAQSFSCHFPVKETEVWRNLACPMSYS